jgi:alpha-L-rhamnosidase
MINALGGATWDFDKAKFRSAPKLALEFSSSELAFEADESFKTSCSPITFDDLRCGEFYDSRKEQKGWNMPGFDDSPWQNAVFVESPRGEAALCEAEPIVTTEIRKAVSIAKVSNGFLYDFGVNAAGICRLRIDGKSGQEITLEHGEFLKDGELYLENISFQPEGYRQTVKYTCNGNDDYTPSFTYFGFRWVLVKGIEESQATDGLLMYHVMNSDLKERGGFECSDETANKLQEFTRRSTLANFYYFPTDCPHREKNGWTGDASLSSEHTLLNLQPEKSYSVWLDNIRKAQDERGALPGIIPTGGWGFKWGNGPAWDNVLINLPYYTYLYRGDKKILEDNAGAIFKYLNYITTRQDERGLVAIGLGDWCPAGRRMDDYKSPLVVTDSVLCMDFCRKAAFVYKALNKPIHENFALEIAANLKGAIRKYLVDFNTMAVSGNCQTSQAMGIFYDVFLPAEKEKAFNALLEYIKQQDSHLDVGILGARVLFAVLSMFGESDLAFEMITRRDFPSYGHWIERGATSLFEDFSRDEEKINSLNHHFYGDISGWFIKYIGGIRLNPYGENVNEANICPAFIKKLTWAKAFHIAPSGRIDTAWKNDNGKIELKVNAPKTMTGKVIAPMGYVFYDGVSEKPLGEEGCYLIVSDRKSVV